MANQKHLEILEAGVYRWNQWREERPDVVPDLREAYLREADLAGYNLRGANLRGAMLLGADLTGADLRLSNLSRTDFRFVEIGGARLAGAQFEKARGVTAKVLRRAQRPYRVRQWLSVSLVPTLAAVGVTALAFVLLRNLPGFGLLGSGSAAWESAAAESAAAESAELVAGSVDETPGPGSARHAAGPRYEPAPGARLAGDPVAEQAGVDVTALLEEVRFQGWSIDSARILGRVLTLRLNVETVDEQVYLPTLAAACGALWGRPELGRIGEIRIVNSHGSEGWAYDRPRNCPALIRAPKHMLRLAAGADSLHWSARP